MAGNADRLILASGSASRRALLAATGIPFVVRPASVGEAAIKQAAKLAGLDAGATALRLANAKAAEISAQQPAAWVIGADQILVCRGSWYDKPVDLQAARRQLLELRGQAHVLATAIVCWHDRQPLWQHIASPRLTMRDFSDRFLDAYLALEGDLLLGSVGAYRLEGPGVQLFAAVGGDHTAILGLPLLPLLEFLRAAGVAPN